MSDTRFQLRTKVQKISSNYVNLQLINILEILSILIFFRKKTIFLVSDKKIMFLSLFRQNLTKNTENSYFQEF